MPNKFDFKRILLAVSGGLDSICLAHYFICNKEQLGIEWLGIAHVHHGLREGSADRDADFVKKFADKFRIPFFLKKLDGKALKAMHGSLEENARNARYESLKEIAQPYAAAIATAHHAGDQAETVYLRLRRGVSLLGLRGIASINNGDIPVVRPLLHTTRKELKEYAKQNQLEWCEDESNLDIKFARNQIRHLALPCLERLTPGASAQLYRIATLANSAYGKILKAANALFAPTVISQENWPFEEKFSPYKNVLALKAKALEDILEVNSRKELFRLWIGEKGFRFPLKDSGSIFQLPFPQSLHCKSLFIEKCRDILWICDQSLPRSGKIEPNNLYFVTDKFSGLNGEWRFRTKGDTLWPADEKIKARKLEKWLREQGIPPWMHDSLPIFANGSRVFFVEGIRRPQKNEKRKV